MTFNVNMEWSRSLCLVFVISSGFVVSQIPDGVVWTSPVATFWLGQTNTELTCETRGKTTVVYWMRGETTSTAEIIASWYNQKSSGPGVDQGTHDISHVTHTVDNVKYSDFSLVFTQPNLEDTGRYICIVSKEDGFLSHNHTDLRVLDPVLDIVNTVPSKTEWKGQTVTLPCDFTTTATRVIWNRRMETGTGNSLQTVLTYVDGIYNAQDHGRYWWSDKFALEIRRLEVTDEAIYTCVVQVDSGNELRNSTDLTVNARAEEPFVKIDGCSEGAEKGMCILEVASSEDYVNIVCRVKGAKPTVNVVWIEGTSGNNILNGSLDIQYHDGESDTTRTLRRQTSEINGNNFTCVASGLAVNGTANRTVVIKMVKAPQKSTSTPAIVIPVVLVIMIIIMVVVAVVLFMNGIWKFSTTEVPLSVVDSKRQKISEFKPADYALNISPLNIGLFGVAGAGKSALTNSMMYSYKGVFIREATDNPLSSQGAQKKIRRKIAVTNFISIVNNPDCRDYSPSTVSEIMEQIKGGQSGEKIHVPVLVCNMSCASVQLIGEFLKNLNSQLINYYGQNTAVVITQKDRLTEAQRSIRDELAIFANVPLEDIWLLENYTLDNHEKDEKRITMFLDFILECLAMGPKNVLFRQQQETEVPEEKRLIS